MTKVLLIATLLYLLILTTVNMPSKLNKQKYIAKMRKYFENEKMDEASIREYSLFSIIVYLFLIILYLKVAITLNIDYITFLSAVQIATCMFNITSIGRFVKSVAKHEYVFNKWESVFLAIVDYLYYPVAIYMLLIK